jgi:hypothetical protein
MLCLLKYLAGYMYSHKIFFFFPFNLILTFSSEFSPKKKKKKKKKKTPPKVGLMKDRNVERFKGSAEGP